MASPAQRQIHRAAMQLFAERGNTTISVTELAQAAGVARGTIYNNFGDLSGLFDLIAAELAAELNAKLAVALTHCDDPVQRLAIGIRLLIRRAHEDPRLGRFVCRFGLSATTLRVIWTGQPFEDLEAGWAQHRFDFGREQLASAVNFISGATLGAMVATLDGARTWSDAASETVAWILVALGIDRDEARRLAAAELPALPE
jgi:AcrR family transcriptional regulator